MEKFESLISTSVCMNCFKLYVITKGAVGGGGRDDVKKKKSEGERKMTRNFSLENENFQARDGSGIKYIILPLYSQL